MRQLHGVMEMNNNNLWSLKQQSMLFDKLRIFPLGDRNGPLIPIESHLRADVDFLTERGFLVPMEQIAYDDPPGRYAELDKIREDNRSHVGLWAMFEPVGLIYGAVAISDLIARSLAAERSQQGDVESLPICQLD